MYDHFFKLFACVDNFFFTNPLLELASGGGGGVEKIFQDKNFFRTKKRVKKIFRANISLVKVQNTFSLTNSS